MIDACRKLIKPIFCLIAVFFSVAVKAQVSLFQKTIDKLENYKNFSYQSIYKEKEIFVGDTVTEQRHATFAKLPGDKNFGYLFMVKSVNLNDKAVYTYLYNGQNLMHVNFKDSTYSIQNINQFNFQRTLPGFLRWIQSRLQKKSSKVVGATDTVINKINSNHLIVNVSDTVINKERNYTIVDLFIDKLSGLPDYITIRSRNSTFGDGISNYYLASSYSDYRFNQANIELTSMVIPKGYHLPKEQPVLPKAQTSLLTAGNLAPDWTLSDADGNKKSFSQMRGKVVILDFFFIGCGGCMESLKPLNNIDEKYKGQNVAIMSLTARDSKKSILEFDKNYHIKHSTYLDAANVVKSYHVSSFPTFYFIDKEGKIASIINGYSDDFQENAISIIDDLLKKN